MSDGIFILSPGPCPRGGTLALGRPGGSKIISFQTWSIGVSNRRDDEQNRMQVKILPHGQTGDLGVRSKGQI